MKRFLLQDFAESSDGIFVYLPTSSIVSFQSFSSNA